MPNKLEAIHLRDESKVEKWLQKTHTVDALQTALERCRVIGLQISTNSSGNSANYIDMIQKVSVAKSNIEIALSTQALAAALSLPQINAPPDDALQSNTMVDDSMDTNSSITNAPMLISVKCHLVRCGKQVKLILGQNLDEVTKVDEQLVDMVRNTRHWFEGLTPGKFPTLRAIAAKENLDRSYVGRLLSIAFLAPDIVGQIVTGNQPVTLTPEKLRKACPLPICWEEQRALLLA